MKTKKQLIDFEHKGNEKHSFKLRPTLLSLCMLTFIGGYSQTGQVNLNLKNATVKELFREIEKQTSYRFSYRDIEINNKGGITISGQGKELKEVLTNELAKQQLSYTVSGNKIIVSPAKKEATSTKDKKVTGKVVDAKGEPVIGATIMEKGTTNGTITDFDGNFTLNVSDNSMLEVSYVGYQTQSVKAIFGKNLAVTLREDTELLDEVVVVGYGTQKKVNLTGAVNQVSGKEVKKITTPNTVKSLQGMSPGLTIIDNGGAPGNDSPTIFLRGIGTPNDSSPLILVDGVEMSLSSIPSSDIESISVLKDAASASIYGARAAHGVILVTTKRAKDNRFTISYDGYVGLQDRTTKPKAVSAIEYYSMVNEAAYNIGKTDPVFDLQEVENGKLPYVVWPNEFFKTSYIQEHTLTVSGGMEKGKYLLSLNALDQPGIVDDTNYNRYNLRMNTDFTLFDRLKIGADIQLTHLCRENAAGLYFQEYREALNNIWGMSPSTPIFYENGYYALGSEKTNPIAQANKNVTGLDRYTSDTYYVGFNAVYDTNFGLSFHGFAGVNGEFTRNKEFDKQYDFYDESGYYYYSFNKGSFVYDTRNTNYQMTLRAMLQYEKAFKKNNLKFIIGAEQITSRSDWNRSGRKGLISTELPEVSLGDSEFQYADGNLSKWGLNSYFGRLNYDYAGKYLFEANVRMDGSSRFAKGNKWGTFPSFSAAWRISEENFMDNLNFISNLKVRGSWGRMGNERIGLFRYLSQYGTSSGVYGGGLSSMVYQSDIANSNITWETVESSNIGLDISVLSDKLYGSFDFYVKNTKDILMTLPIPIYTGLNPSEINAGVVKNSGFESIIGYRNRFGEFNFDSNVSFSYNKNEWVDRNGDDCNISGSTINKLGEALNSYYVYKTDGLIANKEDLEAYKKQIKKDPRGIDNVMEGDIKFVDLDGDGEITADDDRYIVHPNIPIMAFSLNLKAEYKGFDLSMFFQGTAGGNTFLGNNFFEGPSFESFTSDIFRDRWSYDNQVADASLPRLRLADNFNSDQTNDFYIVTNNYLRMKNLQLGYTFPKSIIKTRFISNLRLYINATNLFTIKSSRLPSGYDPETSGYGYPPVSVYSFGVNLQF